MVMNNLENYMEEKYCCYLSSFSSDEVHTEYWPNGLSYFEFIIISSHVTYYFLAVA